jgi:hypothetical protein
MPTESRRYLAYMLRLWQVGGEGELAWRASLESPHTGERHGFASLEALFAFLEEKTRGEASPRAKAPAARCDSTTLALPGMEPG